MRETQDAICLRTADWSETSQVVCFLTRGVGLVRLVAKGSKRPKSKSGGRIDLLQEGRLVFISKQGALGTLVEFTESFTRRNLQKDATRLYAALYALELTGESLAEDDPHPEVFDLLHNALSRFNDLDAPIPAVVAYFQWRLLRNIGLLGNMSACNICGLDMKGSGGKLFFSSTQGGLVCEKCSDKAIDKIVLSSDALAGITALSDAEAGRKTSLPDNQAHVLNSVLAYHATHLLGKRLRTARYVIKAGGI